MSELPGTVLVVGAGPTGMMAALELGRFGIPVRLVEKLSTPATTSRAIGVQARTLELLEQRGLASSLVELGNPARAANIYGGGKRIFRLDFEHIDSRYNYLLLVSQAETEKILREALDKAGVEIERSVRMIALAQADRDAVTAVLEHGDGSLERFECPYLIDSEGAHSIARETSGLQFEGKSLVEDYALGDLHLDGDLEQTELSLFSSEHGFLALFPMGQRRFRMIVSNPISKPAKGTEPALGELQELYDQRSHIPARFHDMTWSSWFRINSRMIHHLSTGRIFLGGDSAHIHSPAGAQGMNTGMQDMINLGWKLAMVVKGQAKPEILETYSADRTPVIKDVLTKTEGLTQAIGSESTVFRSVFNHLAPWIVGIEAVQYDSTEHMSQLSLNYRASRLSASDGHAGTLRAGDRMRDLQVMAANDERSTEQQAQEPSTVFGLLDPCTFTLLYSNFTEHGKTHSELRSALKSWDHLMRVYQIAPQNEDRASFDDLFGKSPSILLVRPDGYIGFTGTDKSIHALAEYCDKWLMPKEA